MGSIHRGDCSTGVFDLDPEKWEKISPGKDNRSFALLIETAGNTKTHGIPLSFGRIFSRKRLRPMPRHGEWKGRRLAPWLLSPFLSLFMVGLTLGEDCPTNIQYQPIREFSSLQQRIGSTLGIAPFKDDRSDKLYIGHEASFRSVSQYFKSEPFPLEKAIRDSLVRAVSRSGVRTVSISNWARNSEFLKNMGADSILMIEIKRFWTEGIPAVRGIKAITSIYLTIQLGVKKEKKVFTRNVYEMKESTVARLTSAEVEQILNQMLAEILDNFLSNPY